MGQTVNTNAFRLGSVRPWPINSSKLFGHNIVGTSYSQFDTYFQSYYFFLISQIIVDKVFSHYNFSLFAINVVDCKLHDYNNITFLNIYIYAPTLRRFYKIFSKIFFFSQKDFRIRKVKKFNRWRDSRKNPQNFYKSKYSDRSSGGFKRFNRPNRDQVVFSQLSPLQQKKIFFYRFLDSTFLNSLFKSSYLTYKFKKSFRILFLRVYKKINEIQRVGFLNSLFFSFFFKIFYFFIFKFAQNELKVQLLSFFPKNYPQNQFKINFYFLKQYWYDVNLIIRRIAFFLFFRRSLSSVIKPFQFVLLRKNKLIKLSKNSFRLQSIVEGVPSGNKVFTNYYNKVFQYLPNRKNMMKFKRIKYYLIKQKKRLIKKRVKFKCFRTRFFRASSHFLKTSNCLFRLGSASFVFNKHVSSLAASVSSQFARITKRGRTLFKRKRSILQSGAFRNLFSNDFSSLVGLKVKGSGRFSKKQMAETICFTIGSIHFSNPLSYVDFNSLQISLKNSTVGIKIWMSFESNFNLPRINIFLYLKN